MIERHRRRLRLGGRHREIRPRDCARQRRGRVEVRHQHCGPQRRQLQAQLLHRGADVKGFPAVAVAVHRDQHRRLDLSEPVSHRAGAEVRGTRRPHRTQARRGEESRQGLHAVRRQRHHPVAAVHTEAHQPGPAPAYQVPQLGAGDLALEPVLPGEHHCHVAVTPPRARAEYVLGIVQRGARKPLGARHALHAEHRGRGLMEPHPDELRHRRPEPGQIADRPGVQCRVIPVRDGHTAPVPHVPCELRDSAGSGMLRIWPPQHLRTRVDIAILPLAVMPSAFH
jgi:hypothetical protein